VKRLLLPLVAVSFWAATASAQLPTETLLVALKSDKTKEGVAESLRTALKVTATDEGTPIADRPAFESVASNGLSVEPISIELYNAYGKLGDSKFQPTELPLAKSKGGGVEIRQLETAEPGVRKWEMKLTGEGNPRLSKLSVKYKGEAKPVEYDDPNSTKKDAEVRYSSPGNYVLTLPTNAEKNKGVARTPESFAAKVEMGSSANPTVTDDEGLWPSSEGYYLVTMKGFPTSDAAKRNFASVITKYGKVGGASLKALNIKKNVSIAVGDAISADGIEGVDTIDGNKFFLKVPVLPRENGLDVAHKAYVLFPLTKEAAAAKVKDFATKKLYETAEGTAKHIRDNKDEGGLSLYTAKDADATIELGKDGVKPRWFELHRTIKTRTTDDPRVPNLYRYNLDESSEYFARPLNLVKPNLKLTQEDAKNLKAAFPDGTAHGVVVYVFDRPGVFNAVPAVKQSKDDKPVYAVVRQFDEWGRALKPIANGESTGDDK
jgi:hypothetical protein